MPKDRRQEIIEAGLQTLREDGIAGFTQARIASRIGLRQSHLTYYYPARIDLLQAVGRAAIDNQISRVEGVLENATSAQEVAEAIAKTAARHDNTRVLMALAQAADQEPSVRELFRELADGIVGRADRFLKKLNPAATLGDARMLHALAVGLAVVEIATGWPDGEQRAIGTLQSLLGAIAKGATQGV